MNNDCNFLGIILAAGEGTRMKSSLPKVLHEVLGRPMLQFIIEAVKDSGIKRMLVVVGYKAEMIRDVFQEEGIVFVTQKERLGTAHAVLQTAPYLRGFSGNCLVLCGDTPLISPQTLIRLMGVHGDSGAGLTILTALLDQPQGYGRIIRDNAHMITGVIEERDATVQQKEIKEINTGIYCFKAGIMFDLLERIGRENAQGEYYLTDAIRLARESGIRISNILLDDPDEIIGVNQIPELLKVEEILRKRRGEVILS